MIRSATLAALLLALATAPSTSRAGGPTVPPAPRPRAAIVVGALAPVPGRALLRHAHHDAETIRDVLVSVGGFAPGQVHVLRDPEPASLLALIEREAAALSGVPQGLLFFYYSGHADQAALWSAGRPVPIEALRAALDRPEISLRVGVLDACQGGGWTRAKGLTPEAPFEVTLPALLASEGSALISSSSGAESAHESDALRGSFFTHHFAAALRGAADERRAGEVTLTEAFEYARQQTIRETARRAAEPQHPSFALNLKGRQDVVLAQIAQSPASLSMEQADGPVELVHLGSGLRLLELPPGRRQVTVAVPPGSYLVRKVAAAGVLAREVVVPPTGAARIAEHELLLVGAGRLSVKGAAAAGALFTDWPAKGRGEVSLGIQSARDGGSWPAPSNVSVFAYPGLGTGEPVGRGADLRLDGRYGVTDRLAWKMGTVAIAYRLGEPDGFDVILSGGLLSWRLALSSPARERNVEGYRLGEPEARLGAGVAFRFHFTGGAVVVSGDVAKARVGGVTGSASHTGIGLTLNLGRTVTTHLAIVAASTAFSPFEMVTPTPEGNMHSGGGGERGWTLVGSAQEVGLTTLPLIRYSPHGTWALDLYSTWGHADGRTWHGAHRIGVSRAF